MEENVINEITFPYQVNTRMPIVGLSIGNLRSPKTVELTKEDVLICVKKAPVFRRFTSGKLVRVGAANLDRLHNEEYMDEKEWEAYLDKRGSVIETIPEKEVPVVEEKKETPVEEVKVEETVEPEINVSAETSEEAQTEEVIEDSTDEINEEEVSEEVTEEKETKNYNNNRYNNKKKHNR